MEIYLGVSFLLAIGQPLDHAQLSVSILSSPNTRVMGARSLLAPSIAFNFLITPLAKNIGDSGYLRGNVVVRHIVLRSECLRSLCKCSRSTICCIRPRPNQHWYVVMSFSFLDVEFDLYLRPETLDAPLFIPWSDVKLDAP